MENPGKYKIKWYNFHQVLGFNLNKFWKEKKYCDVTICVEGKLIPAHRVILASCSPYFEQMVDTSEHLLIQLVGAKYDDVIAILELAYKGEVDIAHGSFKRFMKTATELKIKGVLHNGEPIELAADKKLPSAPPIRVEPETSVGTQENVKANEELKVPALKRKTDEPAKAPETKRRRESILVNRKTKNPGKMAKCKKFLKN